LAHNPFLPATHPQLYHPLHRASPYYVATYLLDLYLSYGPDEILVRALRHPVCDVDVARDMKRIWDQRRGWVGPEELGYRTRKSSMAGVECSGADEEARTGDEEKTPQIPPPTAPPLTCAELPRRLLRGTAPASSSPLIPPLLEYLFTSYNPSPNSHKGYPLCRAVLTSNLPLIDFLLTHGGDPSIKDNLAVEIAVQLKDLRIVKMLVERQHAATDSPAKGKNITPDTGRKGKRQKREDRVVITTKLVEAAIIKGSEEIVHYFVHEKGKFTSFEQDSADSLQVSCLLYDPS
jgi:hypothetical protein